MKNLFFIHTPFQLLVAQLIIKQNKWRDNYMVYGYVYDNAHFLDIYDYMLVPEYWKERILYPGAAGWSKVYPRQPIKTIKDTYEGYCKINKIIKGINPDCICFGDIHNPCYQLLNIIYANRGIGTVYFEEGSSHYLNTPRTNFHGKYFQFCISLFYDMTVFLPLSKIRFAKYILFENYNYDKLPIYERYSIIPFYSEYFDRKLVQPLDLPPKVEDLILSENLMDVIPSSLFISEMVVDGRPEVDCEIKKLSIIEFFKDKDIRCIAIKFHPREQQLDKLSVLEAFNFLGIKTIVISKIVNLPVEYYLKLYSFENVFTFWASTLYYKGYLYNNVKAYTLIGTYLKMYKCKYGDTYPRDIEYALNDHTFMRLFENGGKD